jgi:predicted dehydrogenase
MLGKSEVAMKGLNVALVGAGTMGANHARVVAEAPGATLGVVIDVDENRARLLADRYGRASSSDVSDAGRCDAAILATSTPSHVEIAMALLEKGIPLLIEKPIATRLEDVQNVCSTAKRLGVPVACGFVERFNPVLATTMQLVTEQPRHIVTMRHSPAAPRLADSVIYDLLIHDIDLVLQLMGDQEVTKVTGVAWRPYPGDAPEIADCSLQFSDGGVATLSASRSGQRKLRSIQIFTESSLADVDLLRADLTIYRNLRQSQPDDTQALTYRAETVVDIPFVRHSGEPLARQFDHFLDLVGGRVNPDEETARIIASHAVASMVEAECSAEGSCAPITGVVTRGQAEAT